MAQTAKTKTAKTKAKTTKSDMKTRPTGASVTAFLKAVEPARRRKDAETLKRLMARITGERAKMWGPPGKESIVGFGRYHYVYDSGREGDFFLTGFAPRKSALVVYIMPGFAAADGLMARLGKHKTGRSCLYINSLADVDMDVLEELIARSVAHMREKYDVG